MKVSPGVQPPPNTFKCNFMQSVTRSLYVEDYKGCRVLSVVYMTRKYLILKTQFKSL